MKYIVFVDDEPLVLQGLRRMLTPMRKHWDMGFASGGAEALKMMAVRPPDAVVADMRMPGMNGAELLNQVMRLFPKSVRFILSGYADLELIMQCIGGTHQFLAKPCDAETLLSAVSRALQLDQWINDESLKALVSQLETVPSVPSLYFEILKELNAPEPDLQRAAATIAQDPAMTAKILQLTNSAFFGLSRRMASPAEAVAQLGLKTIKSLVLAIHVFSQFDSCHKVRADIAKMQHHSISTATAARAIAKLESQDLYLLDECFTAGLLHDIGRLVLVANLGARYSEAVALSQSRASSMTEAEKTVFGASHAEVGAYLLGLWGLPLPIVEAALFHHSPHHCSVKGFTSLTAVHVANLIGPEQPVALPALQAQLDREYLIDAGVWERVPAWWQTLSDR